MAVRVSTSKSNWLESDEIWLFCIESKVYNVQLRDCPTISVNVRIAHTSPVNKPMIRRRVLMSDDRLDMLPQTSPLLITINSACNFKFDRDDLNSIFSVGVESWAVLVWSFTCIPGASFTGSPDHGNAIDLPGMPVVNIQEIDCACTRGGSLHFGVDSSSKSTCLSNINEESSDENDNVGFTLAMLVNDGQTDCIYGNMLDKNHSDLYPITVKKRANPTPHSKLFMAPQIEQNCEKNRQEPQSFRRFKVLKLN